MAEQDVGIHAAGDLSIRSSQETLANANTSQSKAIGTVRISDTEKFSGWRRQQHEDDSAQVSQVASNIGSLGGSVNLSAGGSYSQIASNVVATQDINIMATSIELHTADEAGQVAQCSDDLKVGLSCILRPYRRVLDGPIFMFGREQNRQVNLPPLVRCSIQAGTA